MASTLAELRRTGTSTAVQRALLSHLDETSQTLRYTFKSEFQHFNIPTNLQTVRSQELLSLVHPQVVLAR